MNSSSLKPCFFCHLLSRWCRIMFSTSHKHDTSGKYCLLLENYMNMHGVACEHVCTWSMQHTLKQIVIHRAEKLFAHAWRAEKLISTSHIVCAMSRGRQPVVKAKREAMSRGKRNARPTNQQHVSKQQIESETAKTKTLERCAHAPSNSPWCTAPSSASSVCAKIKRRALFAQRLARLPFIGFLCR